MSVVIEINNDPTLTAIANNPGGGTSSVSLQAPIGSDDFIISLYDQAQTPGETTPVGNELGQVELVQSIKSGQTNTVSATVNGIAAKITMTPLPNQSYLQTLGTASAPHFAIVGQNNAAFSVTALDADGNAIVGTGITPTVGLHAAVGTKNFNVVSSDTDASRFTVVPTAANSSGTATLIAQATDALGDAISMNVPVDEVGEVYVSYPGASGSKIVAYDTSGNVIPLADNAFAGLQNPVAMAYDHDDQRLYVADSGLGQLLAFNADGTPVSGFPLTQVPGANGVAYDSNNRLVYVSGANQVVAFTTDGKPVSTGGFQYTNHPSSVAYISGPYIMVGSSDSGTIDVYDESGNWIQNFAAGFTATTGMSADPKVNDVFIAGKPARGGNSVIRAYTYGYIEGGVSVTDPHGLAYDAIDDRLYAVSGSANSIVPVPAWPTLGPVDSADAIVTPASSGLSLPSGLAITY
jgi:hypothetical protein